MVSQTFSERQLQRYLEGERARLDYHNWLEYLDLTWKVITTTDPKAFKKNQTAFDILKSNLREIYKLDNVTLSYKLSLEKEELGISLPIQANFFRRRTITVTMRYFFRNAGQPGNSKTVAVDRRQ